MKASYLMPLAISVLIGISGCQFQERGMSLPAPKVKPRPQTKTTDYDFPLLKLKAFTKSDEKDNKKDAKKEKEEVSNQEEVLQKPSSPTKENQPNIEPMPTKSTPMDSLLDMFKGITGGNSNSKVKKKPAPAPKKKTPPSKRIKNTKKKSIHKSIKKDNIKPRRRKSGHANKLIFNKNSSLKDIPLPLPKLSSLKLKSLSKVIPSVPISKIPILNTIIPKGSKTSKRRIKRKNNALYSSSSQNNHAKKSSSVNLDMANIRIGKSSDYTTLIFDSYVWGGYNTASTQEASSSGAYEFKYEPENNRIVASIQGYSAFSALLGDQSKLFSQSDVIKNIYIDRYIGEGNIQFIIDLKKKVKITVLDVQDPGRIIVTLYPK